MRIPRAAGLPAWAFGLMSLFPASLEAGSGCRICTSDIHGRYCAAVYCIGGSCAYCIYKYEEGYVQSYNCTQQEARLMCAGMASDV